jgi:hypothetical protein
MHPSFALLRLKNVYFFISYYLSALKTALRLRRWAKHNKAFARLSSFSCRGKRRFLQRDTAAFAGGKASAVRSGEAE